MQRTTFLIAVVVLTACSRISFGQTPSHPVDGEYIKEWLVLGPFFPAKLDKDILVNVGGEVDADPREGDIITTPEGKTLTWKRYTAKGRIVDRLDALGDYEHATTYLFCRLRSETAAEALAYLTFDDSSIVWLNGQRAFRQYRYGQLILDLSQFVVNLKAGSNRCLIKVSRDDTWWGAAMRATPLDQATLVSGQMDIPVYHYRHTAC